MSLGIAVNLYSTRFAMEQDLEGTLAGLADIGYHNVELAGYHGRTAAEFYALLTKHRLNAVSAHVPIARFESELQTVLEEAKRFGLDAVVVPWLNPEQRQEDFVRALPAKLNHWGEAAAKAGFRLAYHNHEFEYEAHVGGRSMMHLLTDETHPDFVDFELDLYWVAEAGVHPADELKRLHPRVRMLHAKDRSTDGAWANVGSGIFDWSEIVAVAGENLLDWLIVEHDQPANWKSDLGASYRFLSSLV